MLSDKSRNLRLEIWAGVTIPFLTGVLSDSHKLEIHVDDKVTIPFLTGVLSDYVRLFCCDVVCHNPLLNRGAFRPKEETMKKRVYAVTIPFLTGVLSDDISIYHRMI